MIYSVLSLPMMLNFDISKSNYQQNYQRHPVEVEKSVFVAGTLGLEADPLREKLEAFS